MRTTCPTFNWPLSFSVHREVGEQHRQIGQRHDLRARGQVLADLDLADAEFAVERRAHQLLRDDGLRSWRCRHWPGRRRPAPGIDRRLRSELARGELLGAIELQRGHRRLRLEAGEIALLRAVEQLHQRRARLDAGAGREQDLGDASVDVGGDVDLMHGGEIADRGQQVRNHLGLRLRDGDGRPAAACCWRRTARSSCCGRR